MSTCVQDFEKSILALCVWRARNQGMDGMLAVACVIANRVKAWGKSWAEVVNQFSKDDPETIVWPDVRDPLFLALLKNVESVHD